MKESYYYPKQIRQIHYQIYIFLLIFYFYILLQYLLGTLDSQLFSAYIYYFDYHKHKRMFHQIKEYPKKDRILLSLFDY